MADFARPFPGLAFFDMFLNAPPDAVAEVNDLTMRAAVPDNPNARACWEAVFAWIAEFIERRRREPPRGDVVDAVLHAEIDGRPITETEIIGTIQLLILGGLDTTAGALGQFMIRFAQEPDIPALLRRSPELVPTAVEELLRLDGPFVAIGRTAMCDTEIGGHGIEAGEKVLVYWASANRDEDEFACPAQFDLARTSNRHLAFGAGPHRLRGIEPGPHEPAHRGGGAGGSPRPHRPRPVGRADRVPLGAQPGSAGRPHHLHPGATGRPDPFGLGPTT